MVHIIHKQIFDAKVSYTMVSMPSVVLHMVKELIALVVDRSSRPGITGCKLFHHCY